MEQRISVITLGVADLEASVKFYRDVVGWSPVAGQTGIAFFDMGGLVLALYPQLALEKDFGGANALATGNRVALAYNAHSMEEVDEIFITLKRRGARIVKEPSAVFWGGYSGYFSDPDDHKWEVAYNPFWSIREDGRIVCSGSS